MTVEEAQVTNCSLCRAKSFFPAPSAQLSYVTSLLPQLNANPDINLIICDLLPTQGKSRFEVERMKETVFTIYISKPTTERAGHTVKT